jgi:hypothetical protein
MSLLFALILVAVSLAGCAASGPGITEEARCRHEGGMWRAASAYCDQSGSGGGGY